jgi:hypothetical protein
MPPRYGPARTDATRSTTRGTVQASERTRWYGGCIGGSKGIYRSTQIDAVSSNVVTINGCSHTPHPHFVSYRCTLPSTNPGGVCSKPWIVPPGGRVMCCKYCTVQGCNTALYCIDKLFSSQCNIRQPVCVLVTSQCGRQCGVASSLQTQCEQCSRCACTCLC